jgi:DNA-binding NarL/FixJ family response regulator
MQVMTRSLLSTTFPAPDAPRDVCQVEDCRPTVNGRVLVVETQSLMADALQSALTERGYEVETSSGPSAGAVIEVAHRFLPSCVILNIRFSNSIGSGIDLIEPLASIGARVVMLSDERRGNVLAECLELGAVGWISASAALNEVDSMLRCLLDGGSIVGETVRATMINTLRLDRERDRRARELFAQLTSREALVLVAMIDGLSAEEIARTHFVALTTVRSQIRAVLQKLGVRSQLAAVAMAIGHRELLPRGPQEVRDRRRLYLRDR